MYLETAQPVLWPAALLRRTSVLAEGQNLGAGGIHFRRAFKINRVEAASGGRNPKKKDILSDVLLFWYG